MAEQLICNQQVDGSTPFTSSIESRLWLSLYGGIPEWPKGADCKSVVTDFDGPNPSSPTKKSSFARMRIFYFFTLHFPLTPLARSKASAPDAKPPAFAGGFSCYQGDGGNRTAAVGVFGFLPARSLKKIILCLRKIHIITGFL